MSSNEQREHRYKEEYKYYLRTLNNIIPNKQSNKIQTTDTAVHLKFQFNNYDDVNAADLRNIIQPKKGCPDEAKMKLNGIT